MTDASLPVSMRWIPKGMSVQYLKKAVGTLHAIATLAAPLREAIEGYALQVDVAVRNAGGDTVFTAQVEMWVSPKPARQANA
jgi:hypothetical protein